MAVPDFIQTAYVATGHEHNHCFMMNTILRIMWATAYFSDAVIYIWMMPSVRNLLKKKVNKVRRWSDLKFRVLSNTSQSVQSVFTVNESRF
jgi:hypothetical protein